MQAPELLAIAYLLQAALRVSRSISSTASHERDTTTAALILEPLQYIVQVDHTYSRNVLETR